MKQKDVLSVRLSDIQPDNENLVSVFVETTEGCLLKNIQVGYPVEL